MDWFGLNGIFWWFFICLAVVFMVMAHWPLYRSGLMFKMFWFGERWKEAMANPKKRVHLIRFYVMFAVAGGLGMMGLMSAMIGDEMAKVPCRQACKEAGWETGWPRPNPHASLEERKELPAKCWCKNEQIWSENPLELSLQ
jgi:hypothetical protein